MSPAGTGAAGEDGLGAFDAAWVAERLERALAAVRGEAAGAEALFRGQEASHVRLAESAVVQAARVVEGKVAVRVVLDGREARAQTTDLTDAGLAACARAALERARRAPPASEPPALATPAPLPAADPAAVDAATARLEARDKAAWLAGAFAAHEKDGLALAGRFHTGLMTQAVRSTAGVDAFHRGSFSDLALSALERPAGHRASSYRARFDRAADREAVERLQEEVRGECHRAHGPVEVAPGPWDVVLAPAAVAELLEWLGEIAFASQALDDGLSFVGGREGERVTGEAVTVFDDGAMPGGVGVPMPFDVEGRPKEHVDLIERGVARGIVHDTGSGRRHGCASTGHAQLSDEFPAHGSKPAHLHLAPGDATPEELVGRLDRGLLVTRFHYVNGMIEPRRAVMTGLLRDGAFLVEGGRPVRAVTPLRFTDSILEAFARIPARGGLSRALEAHNGWFDPWRCNVAPWVYVPRLRFTSGR